MKNRPNTRLIATQISPELHRRAKIASILANITLAEWIADAIEAKIQKTEVPNDQA